MKQKNLELGCRWYPIGFSSFVFASIPGVFFCRKIWKMGACDAGMMAVNASPVQQPSWAPPDMATSSGLEVVESSAGPLDMDHVRLAAALPSTLPSSLSTKDGSMLGNQKAEVFALAHRGRVEAEAAAYLEAETRKTEAHAQTLQVGY